MNTYDIFLTRKERVALKKVKRNKSVPGEDIYHLEKLYHHDFLKRNHTDEKDPFGAYLFDGTYSLTDRYYEYREVLQTQRLYSFFLPIAVSAITSIILWLLEHLLWPEIESLLSSLL